MCLTSDEKKHWLVFYVNQWALSCSINQSNQQISSSERFRFKRLWGSLVRLKHFMCLTRNRTQIFCWRRDGWNHNDERLMMMMIIVIITMIESLMSALFSETVCVSSQTFFIEYSKTQYDVCTARSRLNSCSFILKVSEADFWCAVCAAAGAGPQGAEPQGGFMTRTQKSSVRLNTRNHFTSFINNNSFVSLMWKTQQEVALRGKSTAPVCPKHSLFLINQ